MKERVGLVVDTNSGIKPDDAKKLGIHVIPMPFIIDGEEFFEGVNLPDDVFYKKLVNDADIHTSQPSSWSITSMWDELLKDYDTLVHIPMSSSLSKTCENCFFLSQKEEYKDKVFVVDNKRISITLEYSAMEALEMIKNGKSAIEVKEFLEQTAQDSSIYLMVDTLKYLKKGGRVTPAAAILGSLLGIKPILQIQGGKLDAFAKCRTVKSARRIMIEQINQDIENKFGKDVVVNIVHCYNSELAYDFLEETKNTLNNVDDKIKTLSYSIACHTGPGVLAITCCKKHNL